MNPLTELRTSIDARRQSDLEHHLREYRPLVESVLTDLKHALSELAKASRTIKPIAQGALKEYPFGEDDPPSVKREVGLLRARCESVLRLFEDKPAEIEKLIGKIGTREPADFIHVSVLTRVKIDARDAAPLIDVYYGLDSFAQEITEMQHRIEETAAYWAEREKQNAGHVLEHKAVSYQERKGEPEIIICTPETAFDPRDGKGGKT